MHYIGNYIPFNKKEHQSNALRLIPHWYLTLFNEAAKINALGYGVIGYLAKSDHIPSCFDV